MENSTRQSSSFDSGTESDKHEPVSEDNSSEADISRDFVTRFMNRRKRKNTRKPRPLKKWPRKTPKPHMCKHCGKPIWSTPGRSQFSGKRYCPDAPGRISKEEWMRKRRREAGLSPTPSSVPRTTRWRQKQRKRAMPRA